MEKNKNYRKKCVLYIACCILILIICIVACFTIINQYQSSNSPKPTPEKTFTPQETIIDDNSPNDDVPFKRSF